VKRLAFLAVVVCLCSYTLTGAARADTITFGTKTVVPLTGSNTEGAFTYEVVSGKQWGLLSGIGNPAASLSTGATNAPSVGDEIDFFLTGGGSFTFDSFDWATFGTNSDKVNLFGEVGGVTTQQLPNVGAASATAFHTVLPGFSAPIDRLRVVVASAGDIDLDLDNFVFTPQGSVAVPEPSSLTLLSIGGAGLLGYGWRRRKRSVA